jgi:hypothetical protein
MTLLPSKHESLTEFTHTQDELGASLRGLDCLKRLKLLELDIGFPAYPYMTDEDLSLRAWAMSAANAIPRIQRVAFATPLTYFNHHWVTFDIVDRPEHKPGEDRSVRVCLLC